MIFIKLHVCWKTPPTMPVEWHFSWADSVRLKASHWSCLLSLGQTLARNWGTQWGKWLKMMIENDKPWTLSPWRKCFTKVPGRIDANPSKMWFHMIRIHPLETKVKGFRVSMPCPTLGAGPENHGERAERVIARWHATQSLPQLPSSLAGQKHMWTSASKKKTYVSCQCAFLFFSEEIGMAAQPSWALWSSIARHLCAKGVVWCSKCVQLIADLAVAHAHSWLLQVSGFASSWNDPNETIEGFRTQTRWVQYRQESVQKGIEAFSWESSSGSSSGPSSSSDSSFPWHLSSLIECPCQTTSICQASRSCEVLAAAAPRYDAGRVPVATSSDHSDLKYGSVSKPWYPWWTSK